MSEPKFTKGEWVARTGPYGGMDTALVYTECGGFDMSGAPDCIANAHLIAAAPEMYAMLEEVVFDDYPREYIREKIENLLTKARGES